ncbi:MAG: nitronate monooxygenase [Bdellovibrionota bacterium]
MSMPPMLKDLRLPAIAAPMFLVSGDKMVIETCKAGMVGTFPALNLRSTEQFRQWVVEIKAALAEFEKTTGKKAAPFGVNLIVHKSNPRLEADLAVCVQEKVPIIITSLGAVAELVQNVHAYGGVVFHDVTTLRHAQKAAGAGVDGLIAVCAGAGGHAGRINPFALVGQIRQFFDRTLILAGALSQGHDVFAAQVMGADLAYMGTRFIATTESQAQPEYKQMILDCEAEDIIYTPAVSGVPASFMKASLEKAGFKDFDSKGSVDFGHKLTLDDEAKAWKNIWSAGQGVSNIKDVPSVAALVDRLDREYQAARTTWR